MNLNWTTLCQCVSFVTWNFKANRQRLKKFLSETEDVDDDQIQMPFLTLENKFLLLFFLSPLQRLQRSASGVWSLWHARGHETASPPRSMGQAGKHGEAKLGAAALARIKRMKMDNVGRAHRRMHVWRCGFVHSEVHLHGGFMGLVKLGPSGHLYLIMRRAGEE